MYTTCRIHVHKTEQRLSFTLNPVNHPDVLQVEQMIDKTGARVPAETKRKVALAIAEHAPILWNKTKESRFAIAYVESNFKPTLINETGDHGFDANQLAYLEK